MSLALKGDPSIPSKMALKNTNEKKQRMDGRRERMKRYAEVGLVGGVNGEAVAVNTAVVAVESI